MRVGSSSRKAAQAATQQLALFWKKELTTSSSSLKEDEADAGELDSTSTNDDDGDVAEETINIDEEPAERLPPIGIRFPIGQKIQKVFPGYNEPFKGCIVKYRWDSYYLVKYEDGDAEDMSHTDILPFVVVRSERGSSVGGDTTRERRTRSPGRHSTAHPQPVAKKMRLSSPSKRSPSPRRGKRGSPQNAKRDTMSSSPSGRVARSTRKVVSYREDDNTDPEDEAEGTDTEDYGDRYKRAETPNSRQGLHSTPQRRSSTRTTENDSVVLVVDDSDDHDELDALDDEEEEEDDTHGNSSRKRTKTTQPSSRNKARGKTSKTTSQPQPHVSKARKKSSTTRGIPRATNRASITPDNARESFRNPYTAGDGLPIINEPQKMFDDMIRNLISDHHVGRPANVDFRPVDMKPLLDMSERRTWKVATMCSGTESPLLALDMIRNSIREHCGRTLNFQHVFSCEIEPFKQAYIERNFRPPLLFRDIRDLKYDRAPTAYGGVVRVPNRVGDVDILIAGTSCVDYSNLNNKQKTIDDDGESGQTFRGMMKWIEKAKPPIVIIENVYGAPWDRKVELFREQGYAATFLRLDTKDYYIPHTRQRGYLFAIKSAKKGIDDESRPKEWEKLVTQLKRPASASLDAFMLPNDDPRVLRGRARLTIESLSVDSDSRADRVGRIDWTKCETRHQRARANELLGHGRPLTEWSEVTPTRMPGFAWNDWTNSQVHRIHDLMDINTLRLAKLGVDCTFKTMVWNLSQNVDRDTMGKLGLCQCLTPTGVPYVTNRGGPLVGEELLLLQGIPADDLLLTKETEDNLKDLAGNAMSTTVVGVCTLCAILVAYPFINRLDDRKGEVSSTCLVPRPLFRHDPKQDSSVDICKDFGIYETYKITLSSEKMGGKQAWQEFIAKANSSARKCVTEGAEEALPLLGNEPPKTCDYPVICVDCGQTSSSRGSKGKYEEHNFIPLQDSSPRVQPSDFREELKRYIPMHVRITGLDVESLEKPTVCSSKLWDDWKTAVNSLVNKSAYGFRLATIVRSHTWTVNYYCRNVGRIELRFNNDGPIWFLFCEVGTETDPELRFWLDRPLARLHVKIPLNHSFHVIDGFWEMCLPVRSPVELFIEGCGDIVESWRNRLGLQGKFANEYQFQFLNVAIQSGGDRLLKEAIEGCYEILPKCGGACGSLRKRRPVNHEVPSPSTFLFLESGRTRLPEEDLFMFAPTCHRLVAGEFRESFLEIDKESNFLPWHLDDEMHSNRKQSDVVRAHTLGIWRTVGAQIDVPNFSPLASCLVESQHLKLPIRPGSWKKSPELISCQLPLSSDDELISQCMKLGGNVELNLSKCKRFMEDAAFVTARFTIPALFSKGRWLMMDRSCDDDDVVCEACSPRKPNITWLAVKKGGRITYEPIEDGLEAAEYERALKARPSPWVVRLLVEDISSSLSLRLQIGCNPCSLAQRALGLLPVDSLPRISLRNLETQEGYIKAAYCSYDWRVVPHVELTKASLPRLQFTSNKYDNEAGQPPNFRRYPLRKEQLRSLQWMQQQESTTEVYFEEEVAESILPNLNWRIEGRVRRPVLARGGIIADEVGYGKTAITLGLIDSSQHYKDEIPRPPGKYSSSHVATKATLIIVPGHLMGQWPEEVNKFLGKSKRLCVIKNMASFNSLTVADIQRADIVLVNFTVLTNQKYFERLARLAGINPGSIPSSQSEGRRFSTVYKDCTDRLGQRVSEILQNCTDAFKSVEEDARRYEGSQTTGALNMDNKKAAYKCNGEIVDAKLNFKLEQGERDPWGLGRKNCKCEGMKCPPLEMFYWKRIVVDEFTYLVDSKRQRVMSLILELKSSFRWFLSGTPPHETFDDVSFLATLLGVHLGVDDALPTSKIKRRSDNTGLENLSFFLETRSLQWHERRHHVAQLFLDRFVRQNIAEIDEIPFEEAQVFVKLPAAERAIYLELETHLKSLEMNSKSAQLSKKRSNGDRENRMQQAIVNAETAEEALIKCCCHFDLPLTSCNKSSSASAALDELVKIRETEKCLLIDQFTKVLEVAFRQQRRILQIQPDWSNIVRTETGEIHDALREYLALVEANQSVVHGADNETNLIVKDIARRAKQAFQKNPSLPISDSFLVDSSDDEANDSAADDEKLFDMKLKLRDFMHQVRSLGKALCGRVRSLRFIQWVHKFLCEPESLSCESCGRSNISVHEMGILSCCGHIGCMQCLKTAADKARCIDASCSVQGISLAHVVSTSKLGLENPDNRARFGTKLSQVVEKVKKVTESGDRLIIFCQFDDLKGKIQEALDTSGILSLQVNGSVDKQTKAVSIFQKAKPSKDDPKVLILKMDDEQSAGLNLTNLNHAVFVHPLLAESQVKYDSFETQAIGRIRRYGQTKTVFIWRFLAEDTIDQDIYTQRTRGD